jgi:hypothetical protein
MSFAPVIPFSGYSGWKFLEKTGAKQQAVFAQSAQMKRDEAYFRDKIGEIKSAEDLVKDRRLLSVALGAFGLEGDLGNKAYIQKVLKEGTLKPEAFASKLANKQYAALSATFGFDLSVPRNQVSGFADKIIGAWKTRSFEAAVGVQNNDMRLAMNARRELAALAGKTGSADTKWLNVIGNTPLRQVFETAFGLPSSFVALDVDKQVTTLRDKAAKVLGQGEVAQFKDAKQVDRLIRTFLTRSDLANSTASAGASALSLLQNGLLSVRY